MLGCPADDEPGAADVPVSDLPSADVQDENAGDEGEPAELGPEDVDEPDAGCGDGEACDDGDPCTVADTCDAAGGCAGKPKPCDDGLECTVDLCQVGACDHVLKSLFCVESGPSPACVPDGQPGVYNPCATCDSSIGSTGGWLPISEGEDCDDGDACTEVEKCLGGQCTAVQVLACEESANPCLDIYCDPAIGCTEAANDAACDDGNACTTGDQCALGQCNEGGVVLACDDGDPCTLDTCDSLAGCVATADLSLCDDGDPCTTDVCGAGGTCDNPPFEGPCEDGDPCTGGEVCQAGVCGGGTPVDCADDNPCTTSPAVCDPDKGCQYFFAESVCSDGYSCTTNDKCVAGQCVGAKSFCPSCPSPVTGHALKVIDLKISGDGNKGSALDVDGDPTTCSPAGSCSDGIDNALSVLASLVNGPLTETLESGAVLYVVDFDAATFGGAEFPFGVYDSNLTEADALCEYQLSECSYEASQFSFGPDCAPYFGLPNAKILGNKMVAGGTGYTMTIALALSSSTFIPLTIVNARVVGDVTFSDDGTEVQNVLGIIGGATPKSQLISTIESLDPDVLPVDKDLAISLLETIVQNDIDLDGDGEKDAASLGIRFKTIPANLE